MMNDEEKIIERCKDLFILKENCDRRHSETKDLIASLDKSVVTCSTQLKWITALLSGTLATALGAIVTKIFNLI